MFSLINKLMGVGAMISVASLFSFFSCDTGPINGTQQIDYNQAIMKADAVLKIVDGYTGKSLAGAIVSIVGVQPALSDSNGVVTIKEISAGEYLMLVEKQGYQTVNTYIDMTLDSNSRTVPIMRQSVQQISLAKLGVTVKGRIYYIDSTGAKKPAGNVGLDLTLFATSITGFINPVFTVTTSATGDYTVNNIPEFVNFSILTNPLRIGSTIYRSSRVSFSNSRHVGDTLFLSMITLTKSQEREFVILSNNTQSLTPSTAVLVTFSDSIDQSTINYDSILVTNGSNRILSTISVSGATLSILPFQGTWSSSISYRLYISGIHSVNGGTLSNVNSFYFRTSNTGSVGDVNGIKYGGNGYGNDTVKADYSTTTIYLRWRPLLNAQSYDIYLKSVFDSTWNFSINSSDTNSSVSLPSGSLNNAHSVQIIVLGKNSSSQSNFGTATPLMVRDEVKPTYSNLYIYTLSGCNNTSGSFPDSAFWSSNTFVEPMDTTIKPVLSSKESFKRNYPLYGDSTFAISTMEWRWISTTTGSVRVTIPAGKNGAYDTLLVNMKGLKDVAGNQLDTLGTFKGIAKIPTFD